MTWAARVLCVLAPLILLLAAAFVVPDWFRAVGVDVGTLPGDLQRLSQAAEKRQELEAARVKIVALIAAKDRIAADLTAQRLTLPEAARRFRALSAEPPIWEHALAAEPGASEFERLCRHVIHWTQVTLQERPEEARHVGERLEAELHQYLRRQGEAAQSAN
jgi:hypothetical protein